MRVVEFLSPPDYAALVIANPRLHAIMQTHSGSLLSDPVFVAAIWLATTRNARIDEDLLRKYALDVRATSAGCATMTALSGSMPGIEVDTLQDVELWSLVNGSVRTKLCLRHSSFRLYFEGEAGAERHVRAVTSSSPDTCLPSRSHADGLVTHFEGQAGAERKMRVVHPDGCTLVYDGVKGEERIVQVKYPDGSTRSIEYEGEGAERRKVRWIDSDDGSVTYFEGEAGAERKMRMVQADGSVCVYNGVRGEERIVQVKYPDGSTRSIEYEGEGTERRKVRWIDSDDGSVTYFEGEAGAERKVRLESGGSVWHFEGEAGAERKVRMEHCGAVLHFGGQAGTERMLRMSKGGRSPRNMYLDGEAGAERLVCTTAPPASLGGCETARLFEGAADNPCERATATREFTANGLVTVVHYADGRIARFTQPTTTVECTTPWVPSSSPWVPDLQSPWFAAPPPPPSLPMLHALPPAWREVFCSSGTYYHNVDTGQVTWNRPHPV